MQQVKRNWLASITVLLGAMFALAYFQSKPSVAQTPSPDVGTLARRSTATEIITLKFEDKRGEPKVVSGVTEFPRSVETYWISVVGVDAKFTGNTEKQINRQMFWVDPLAKVNGRRVEVTGKLGIRDGSGNWDDSYEGTITVAVTAVMAND